MGCDVFLLSKRGELLLLHLIEHHHLSRTGQLLEYICGSVLATSIPPGIGVDRAQGENTASGRNIKLTLDASVTRNDCRSKL